METRESTAVPGFVEQFTDKRELVVAGVAEHVGDYENEAAQHGRYMELAAQGYLSVVERGGKRTRGVLAMAAYELFGGEPDDEAAVALASAVEMLHGYLLVVDDVADKSDLRRGGPTAHVMLNNTLQSWGVEGDTKTLGENIAISTALWAQHRTVKLLGRKLHDLGVPPDRRYVVEDVLHDGLELTGVGQILDLFSTVRQDMAREDAEQIATYKTAFYSYLLPLQAGAALAGATAEELQTLTEYALNAGLAFQLEDDRLGLYGTEEETGKPCMSDLIEGKRTILYLTAFEQADSRQRKILEAAHGNPHVTEAEFKECLAIIRDTGAYDEVVGWTQIHAQRAVISMQEVANENGWPSGPVRFLQDMALFGANRRS